MVLTIPGSNSLLYSGGALVEDNVDTTSASIVAYGEPFTINVNNVDVGTGTMGFSLTYSQVPCGSTVTSSM